MNQPDQKSATSEGDENASDVPQHDDAEHLVEPDDPLPPVTLEELPAELRAATERAGWKSLMPVQSRAMPYLLSGERDIMVQSRTGSGKTGAFILPILASIDPTIPHCQALVLVPTRELALQVTREGEMLGGSSGINVVSVYGGVGYGPQVEAFRKGAHIVVGTPGRILDHLMKRNLDFDDLHILVFDEADRMLSMGFYPDMVQLRGWLPRDRRGYMFSATFTPQVIGLADQFLERPAFLSLSRDKVHVSDIEHVFYEVPSMDKDRALVRIIEMENPTSAIIFCNRKDRVNYVATVLQRFGYDADQITSDLAQNARERVLARVRAGGLRFLVATDLAGRGIDIPNLSHVFMYEFPEDPESYIHRAGRTGRAGATGTAMTLAAVTEIGDLERTARRFGINLEKRELPTEQDVQAVVAERVTALLEQKLRSRDRLQLERMSRFLPLAHGLGESDDELAIIAMLLDDYYQESLHGPPPDQPRATPAAPRSTPRSGGEQSGPRSGGKSGGGGGRRPRSRGGSRGPRS